MMQAGALDRSSWLPHGYPAPVHDVWIGSYIYILVLHISEADADGAPLSQADRTLLASV
jgi:hypothetical protein